MHAKLAISPPSAMLQETQIFSTFLARMFLRRVFLKGMFAPDRVILTNINRFTFKGIVAFAFSTFMGIFGIYTIAAYGMKRDKKTPERAPLLAGDEQQE
jgi:hypothetical protein